ncbi:hypothetical protein HCA99_01435 [Listeria booriae]|uniref:hypothetical protein n=1 Tax=Listeria booriae TaxID=1552123 RepID=UPI0016267C09|nr:hypothetical protein [Listeria booriae]MBC2077873.1 hypothetical protein [Listeria booriae]
MNGFKITKLVVTGATVKPVSLLFSTGLNLVTGPSNTGKTYAFQCIDYIFGNSSSPKDIPEGKGYDTIFLEIQSNSDKTSSVYSRSLVEENSILYYEGVTYENKDRKQPINLIEKHDLKKPNISSDLLRKFGFTLPIKIKKSSGGAKVSFSFRYLSPLLLIKEDTMIQERSPIYTGASYTDRTQRAHAFKFLMTGTDDSELEEKDNDKIFRAKKTGNLEILEQLFEKEQQKLLDAEQKEISLAPYLNDVNDVFLSVQTKIGELNSEIIDLEKEQKDTMNNIKYNNDLHYKFTLLMEQYDTDIERLKFIDEGTFLLNQLRPVKCPHCGETLINHTEHNHDKTVIDVEQALYACEVEINKIQDNIMELKEASATVNETIQNLSEDFSSKSELIRTKKNDITEFLQPKLETLNIEFQSKLEHERIVADILLTNERIVELQKLIKEASTKKNAVYSSEVQNIISTINNSRLINIFSENLKAVIFDDTEIVNVEFFLNDDTEIDYKINNKNRESYGKGYRSLIVSVFYASMTLFCEENELPYSPFLVLDSPINAFRDTVEREQLSNSTKNKFFNFLNEKFKNKQVILFENDTIDKNDKLYNKVNITYFTRNDTGRYGFFPHNTDKLS